MKQKLLLFMLCLLMVNVASAQSRLSGVVKDADTGEGLPGVNINIKGSNIGTVTDFDGNYNINASSGDILVFSFIGYKAQEIKLAAQSTLNVNLVTDITQLSEVVVVGYGVQTKREVTGSIASVSSQELNEIPVPSFEAALQGRAAGVQVVQGSGMSGSGSIVRIRGISSVSAAGDPLYVIDGIPVTQDQFILGNGGSGAMNYNPLATLNPNDIASIDILKDAAAAGIYGSRGANGVVLITTKKGKKGKPSFNFNSTLGISDMAFEPDMLSAAEYIQLRQEAWENDGNTGRVPLPDGFTWEEALANDTDWIDETTQTGFNQSYNLSGTYGKEKFTTYVGLSYSDNESFLKGNSFERMSARANFEYKVLDNLSVTLSQNLSRGLNDRVDLFEGSLGAAMSSANPIFPIFDEDDPDRVYYLPTSADPGGWGNPVRVRELLDWQTREYRSVSNMNIVYNPIERVTITATGGLDYLDLQDDQFRPSELINSTTSLGNARQENIYITNFNYSVTAAYDFSISDDDKVKVLIGNEFQRSTTDRSLFDWTDVSGPVNDDFNEGTATTLNTTKENVGKWSFISYFGRLNYSLLDKYFIQGTARVDGSSRFGKNNRYGFFPSASVAWLMSEENFFGNGGVVSFLKLKASWGLTGNANMPDFQRFGNFGVGQGGLVYNGQPTIFPERLNNPDLQWERTRTIDFGVEAGFLEDRITAELAYYHKNTTDVLINIGTQPSTGFSNFWDNFGEIENKGVELSLNSRNLVGEFKWTTTINMARNSNKVLDIGGYSSDAIGGGFNDTRVVEGEPVGANFLVRFSRVDPESGRPIWLDADGNETFDFDLENRVVVGSVIPDLTGGIGNKFEYKNFDLNVFFTFTLGGNIYDGSAKRQVPSQATVWNFRGDIADRWRQPGDIAELPKLTLEPIQGPDGGSVWQYNSTLFLYDASYLRLRSLSLGYNLPSSITQKLNLKNVRLSVTGSNLLTFTKYPGDPEIARDFQNAQDRNLSPNVSFLTPPQQRSFTFGLNVQF
ncbi:MAG: TonB-dependent receptor [Fulvivirga sp.]